MPTQSLRACLEQTPSRQLFALLATHHFAIASSRPKAELVERLYQHLTQRSTHEAMITQVNALGKDALRALLAADGALPAYTFQQRFGPIRPYRPWRADETVTVPPWQAPSSTTETLWYLGLIFLDPPKPTPGHVQHYIIPADLLPALATLLPPPVADQNAFVALPRPGRPADLLVHLGIWLASIAAEPVTPLHGRWLPPRLVAALVQRLGLDQAPDFRPQRSERHLPYLAFLHYLTEVAELAGGTERLAITPQGWRWLAATPAERWRTLWQSWVTAPVAQAHPYRFPWRHLSPQSRQQILRAIRPLPLDRFLPVAAQLAQWRLQDVHSLLPTPLLATEWSDDEEEDDPSTAPAAPPPTNAANDPVAACCTGPLFWLGLLDLATMVEAAGVAIRLTPHGAWLLHDEPWRAPVAPPVYATITKGAPDTLLLPVQAQPLHLAQLAPLCQWEAAATGAAPPLEVAQTLTLDEARIAQAVAHGHQPSQIFQHLADALGRPPSRRLRQRIQRWAAGGQQVRLRPLLVLETATAELLTELQRHQLIRRRLDDTLGPRHAALSPAAAPALLKTLQTLSFYCAAPPEITDAPLANGAAGDPDPPPAFQWLLLALYRGLGAYLPLPVKPPWNGAPALAARLSPMQRAAAESAAATILADLHATIDGYLRLPAWQMETFPTAETIALLQAALPNHQDVEIRYWSVSSGGPTLRRVTPQRIEEQAGVPYLHAYCHLRQTERIFRIDRIESIVLSPQSPAPSL